MKKLLTLLIALCFASAAQAATTANSVVTAQTPNNGKLQFTGSSSAGTYATVYTGGTNGSKLIGLFVSNTDSTATHVVTCAVFNGGTQYASYSVTTTSPAAGAYNNLAMLQSWVGLPVDSDGNPFMYLISGDTVQCTFATAITAAKFVDVLAIAADF